MTKGFGASSGSRASTEPVPVSALSGFDPGEICTVPPEGWWCSRAAGHDGPCAARQIGEPWDGPLTALEQKMIDDAWERHKAAMPLYAELEAADKWLQEFAEHASWCAGNPGDCRCGLNHIRAQNCAALTKARGER